LKTYRFHSIPPAGNKIPPALLLRALWQAKPQPPAMPFSGNLGGNLDVNRNVLFLSSGRAALWLTLKAASRLQTRRQEVIVPAYTCPAVISAVLKAGLQPVLCDINLEDFGYLPEALADTVSERTLAVVAVHLFGYPCVLGRVLDIARRSGSYAIEDAAQAFGNPPVRRGGPGYRPGFKADAGFFSFGRGKPLSVLHGGVLIASSEDLYHEALRIYGNLNRSGRFQALKYSAYLAAYWLFWRPSLYWIPSSIPFLHLGETLFEKDFLIRRGLPSAGSVLASLMHSLEREVQTRSATAAWYSERLGSLPGLFLPPDPAYPYLRYPLVAATNELRDRILCELSNRGFKSAVLYPAPLNELPRLREVLQDTRVYPNAHSLSSRLVTLPLHSGLSHEDRSRLLEAIRKACAAPPCTGAESDPAGSASSRELAKRERGCR
jgi:perosamine synthetase